MSRSLHTQKLQNRAARRLARPYATRKAEAERISGKTASPAPADQRWNARRVHAQKPLPGMLCPLECQDVHAFLETLGPVACYGLQTIRLRNECAFTGNGLLFGEYRLPCEIHLYSTPKLPWKLPFLMTSEDIEALVRYGAEVSTDEPMGQTIINWTEAGLKAFYLVEVLAHELGHHQLQYHHGKRSASICRLRDHERRANLQSRRVRKWLRR